MPSLETNIRLSFLRTRQAFQFTRSALNIFQQVHYFELPPNPIKIQRYQDALSDLTNATIGFRALPTDPVYPPDPVFPTDPVFPPNVDPQVIIRLAQNRTLLAIARNLEAINFMDEALSLTDSDSLGGQLTLIKSFQVSALEALNEAFDLPPVASPTDD